MPKPTKPTTKPKLDLVLTDLEQGALESLANCTNSIAQGKARQVLNDLIHQSKRDPDWLISYIMHLTIALAKASEKAKQDVAKSSPILPGQLKN